MGRIFDSLDRLAAFGVTTAIRLAQLPAVMRERVPAILTDETLSPPQGDVHAIVVKYAGHGMTEDFRDLLLALRGKGVNAIVVCNGALRAAQMDELRGLAQRVLVRPNIGRDMGGYRAATLHLHAAGLRPRRMIYLNDSVFYLRGPGLDAMVAALADGMADMFGTFENHEIVHHLGSYAFSIAGAVFDDPRILGFWRRYRPYDLRPHAIRRGELAYSERVRRCGYRQDVIYSVDKLERRLDAMTWPQLVAQLRHVPIGALRDYRVMDLVSGALETGADLVGRSRRPTAEGAPTPTISGYREHQGMDAFPPAERAERQKLADRIRREVLVNHMIDAIHNGSQIHRGFGLFHRVMDAPLVKKDLLLRDFFDEPACARILDRLPPERRDAVMRELINRGRLIVVPRWRRFKVRHGLE